jgi:hypothetical protein
MRVTLAEHPFGDKDLLHCVAPCGRGYPARGRTLCPRDAAYRLSGIRLTAV